MFMQRTNNYAIQGTYKCGKLSKYFVINNAISIVVVGVIYIVVHVLESLLSQFCHFVLVFYLSIPLN